MRPTSTTAALLLSWSAAAPAQPPSQEVVADFRVLDALDPCRAPRLPDEVVVCGRRAERNRYRLPLPGATRAPLGAGNVRGEVPRAMADGDASGACGIFEGQRRCSEAEMAEFGYGQGRNPITFIGNIVARLTDPDADPRPDPK